TTDSSKSRIEQRPTADYQQRTTNDQQRTTNLSRWPAETAAPQEMKVDMKHRLAGGFAVVADDAVAVRIEMQIARDGGGAHQRRADDRCVALGHVVERRDVLARNDQHVRRRLRV